MAARERGRLSPAVRSLDRDISRGRDLAAARGDGGPGCSSSAGAAAGWIDGKSPIEYVTEEREKNQVRDFARRNIAPRVDRLDVIRDAWAQQVHA